MGGRRFSQQEGLRRDHGALAQEEATLAQQEETTARFEDLIEGPMKFDDYGYRFHGTNAPRSIGHNQSHGCVRMIPDDARKVAALIKENVGQADRRESENGTFVILSAPVRLNLIK